MFSMVSKIVFLTAAFLPLVLSIAHPKSLLPMAPMQFQGKIGGIDVALNGTVEQIFAQFLALHPGVALNLPAIKNDTATRPVQQASVDSVQGDRYCWPVQDWGLASQYRTQQQIDYLHSLHGSCTIPARRCVRMSCSWRAGVTWCNDAYQPQMQDCYHLGSWAQIINDKCWRCDNINDICGVCGQDFDDIGTNLIVKSENC